MEPLRVDFILSSAITEPVHPIHLDALVAWAAVNEAIEHGNPEPLSVHDALPFAQQEGVWCASALSFDYTAPPFTVSMTKRTDIEDFRRNLDAGVLKSCPNKLDLNRGPFRQALVYTQVRHASSATCWCLGDRERLSELLQRLSYLGAKRRNGRGRITSVDVVHDSEALERWRERIVPDEQPGFLPLQAVTRPPYWDRSRVVNAWAHPNIV